MKRGAIRVIINCKLPDGASALRARFVISIKSAPTVTQNTRCAMSVATMVLSLSYLIHNAQKIHIISISMLLAIAAL